MTTEIIEKMTCEGCGEKFNQLYCKNPYNGNKDSRYLCLDCYFDAHGEDYE